MRTHSRRSSSRSLLLDAISDDCFAAVQASISSKSPLVSPEFGAASAKPVIAGNADHCITLEESISHQDRWHQTKLTSRRTRRNRRLRVYAVVTLLSLLGLFVAPVLLEAISQTLGFIPFRPKPRSSEKKTTFRALPRFQHQDIRSTSLPDQCRTSKFSEPGWVFHAAHDVSSTRSSVWYDSMIDSDRPALRMLESQSTMSQDCSDLWIANGIICQKIQDNLSTVQEVAMDVTWTFVEPTNHWRTWKDAYASGDSKYSSSKGTRESNFRSYDQLRFSLRSVMSKLSFVQKVTLLSASLPSTPPKLLLENFQSTMLMDQLSECRVMQLPEWFNASKANATDARIRLLSHWDLFNTPNVDNLEAWRKQTLPAFNSHAIESQLVNIPNQSEILLYMNDDFYVGQVMVPSDFASALYGPVYRVSPTNWVHGTSDRNILFRFNSENRNRISTFTVGLINERFGKRDRNWLSHVAYVNSVPMMQEVASIWADELKQTAESRFRGRGTEVYLPLLATLYNIEKHREILLWSFFMARSDVDGSGTYSLPERETMLANLGERRSEDRLGFRVPDRPSPFGTYAVEFGKAGLETPRETDHKWSSKDGYFYMGGLHRLFPKMDGRLSYFCKISVPLCFGSGDFFDKWQEDGLSSQWLFKNMAFDNPRCGDCIIAGLVTASGTKGLEAFLPPKDHLMQHFLNTHGDGRVDVPYMGKLSTSWRDLDFSLMEVLGASWTPRDFVVRSIQRYSYVIGQSSFIFDKLYAKTNRTRKMLNAISERVPGPAFIALNDGSAGGTDEEAAANYKLVQEWHEKTWTQPNEVELPELS